jgi:hypothetical protein
MIIMLVPKIGVTRMKDANMILSTVMIRMHVQRTHVMKMKDVNIKI